METKASDHLLYELSPDTKGKEGKTKKSEKASCRI